MKPENRVHGLGLQTDLSWVNLPENTNKPKITVEGNIEETSTDHKRSLEETTLDAWHTKATMYEYVISGDATIQVTGKNINAALHLTIKEGTNATLHIIQNIEGTNGLSTDITAEKNSDTKVIQRGKTTKETFLYGRRDAHLQDEARLDWIQAETGGKTTVTITKNYLDGDNARSEITHLYAGIKKNEFDVEMESHHTGENSYSFIRSRGILKNSKSTTRGLVRINKPAFSSDGYQKSDVVLLDNNSNAVSIPDLEIRNHDVKCSHGSTISDLDETKLHYMKTRGIHEKTAQKTLIHGFFSKYIPEEAQEELEHQLIEPLQKEL